MKKIGSILFLLSAMLVLAGCSGDDDNAREQARHMLEGKWNLVTANGNDASQNGGYLIFSSDGQMELCYSAGTDARVSPTLFADDRYVNDDGAYCGHLYNSLYRAEDALSEGQVIMQYPGGYCERDFVAVSGNRLVLIRFDLESA